MKIRIALLILAILSLLLFSLAGSSVEGDDWIIRINGWVLIALPAVIVLGYWLVKKSG